MTTRWRQISTMFLRWAIARNIAACVTGWSNPPMNKRACSPRASPEKPPATPAALRATNLKVSGVNVFSAGDFIGGEGAQQILYSDPRMGLYKKLVIENDRLMGAVLIGDTAAALSYLDLIRTGADVTASRDELMFGDAASLRKAA